LIVNRCGHLLRNADGVIRTALTRPLEAVESGRLRFLKFHLSLTSGRLGPACRLHGRVARFADIVNKIWGSSRPFRLNLDYQPAAEGPRGLEALRDYYQNGDELPRQPCADRPSPSPVESGPSSGQSEAVGGPELLSPGWQVGVTAQGSL
jgi:hypothetical protein